jgi:alpha-methylacyl-CoA racemase
MQMTWAFYGQGRWADAREANLLDGGAPHYDTYTCADGRHVAVGALEPQFYAQLLAGLGLDPAALPAPGDVAGWPTLRARFTAIFATRTRDEWVAVFDGTDACVTPVLALGEVADHPHLAARGSVVAPDGMLQAAPAPRFSRTPATLPGPPAEPEDVESVLADWAPRPS